MKNVKYRAAEAIKFMLILSVIFLTTFGPPGETLKGLLSEAMEWCIGCLSAFLEEKGVNETVRALITEGICPGVASVLSFLPVIGILFACLFTLEECGYMERISSVFDPAFRMFGLPGEAMIPLLTGFGCSVPAIMAAAQIQNRRERTLTVFLIPYMSCSAKIPMYVMICSAIFPGAPALAMLAVYLFGALTAGAIALAVLRIRGNSGKRKGGDIARRELRLRYPNPQRILLRTFENMLGFVKKAFTVILIASTVIWTLENFNADFELTTNPETGILAGIGKAAAPVFEPIGLGDWRIATALLSGLSAKEASLSTLSVLLHASAGENRACFSQIFTPASAASFLIFYLMYVPCIASLTAVRKVTGRWRCAAGMAAFQCVLAWIAAFVVYHVGTYVLN